MSFASINYNLYKSFAAVYRNMNITRAAEELHFTQPAISQSIRELEGQLETKLFIAQPRGVQPTKEADELYNLVISALVSLDNAESMIKDFNTTSIGHIRVVCATNFASQVLVKCITEFNKKYPNISFDILNARAEDAINVLEKGGADLVFSTMPLGIDCNCERIILKQMQGTYFTSKIFAEKHSLQTSITKEQFEELPLISHRTQNHGRKAFTIVDSQETVFQLVNSDFGIGFCLEEFFTVNHPNIPIFKLRVEGAEIQNEKWEFSCLYKKDIISKPVKEFLQELKRTSVFL